MFEHSVKVPRHYKVAANIVKKVSTEGGSVKTLLYDDKLRHFRTNVLYALITETIKHAADLDKIFESCSILEKESRLDPWLAKVLAAELLFGKKCLPGQSKPEQTILSYKPEFEKYTSDHQDDLRTEAVRRPRYVRVNTNLLTTSDAIRVFQDEGYRFIRCPSGSYDDYLKQIQRLTEYDFTQDYHVKTVFVFSPGTKWHDHELYVDHKIILQDKATTMAVHLLAPPPGSTVLDMCAAPGMKTTQLAAFMRNQGKIYAVERSESRYQVLCQFVNKTESKCVETIHNDCFDVNKNGELNDVEYIILDPSCSGSGMDLCVHKYKDQNRLAKLTSLQEKILKHAMNSFPKAKRIVYSTCSLFPEENERVITNVVKNSRSKWRVQDVKELLKGQWNNAGSAMYGSMGTRCMYALPDSDLTTGFFLAVLDRDEKDMEKTLNVKEKRNDVTEEIIPCQENDHEGDLTNSNDARKKKAKARIAESPNNAVNNAADNLLTSKKKHKFSNEDISDAGPDIVDTEANNKKKKKKKEKHNSDYEIDHSAIGESVSNDVGIKPKKRKKDKISEGNDQSSYLDNNMTVKEETDISEQPVVKKKKKKSQSEKDIGEYVTSESQTLLDSDSKDFGKPKKRKKCKTSEGDIDENINMDETATEETEDSGQPVKNKKSKRKEIN